MARKKISLDEFEHKAKLSELESMTKNKNDIQVFIDRYTKLLPVDNSLSTTEMERRAGEFLVAQATLADIKRMLVEEKIKLTTVHVATYAQEMSKGVAKTVTENKLAAEASEAYIVAREDLERIENDISYLKTYGDIFNNAHLFYRSMMKENGYT